MSATLTDNYISAAVRTLPPEMQDDVRAELVATIADDIDARVELGEPHGAAERAALTNLGDPELLAAAYADRPLQLIGPKYYLTWLRVLKVLLAIVPASVAIIVLVTHIVIDTPIVDTIAAVISAAIGAVMHVAFWTTLFFAIVERTGGLPRSQWTVDALPRPSRAGASRGDLIATLAVLGIMAAAMLWDRFVGFVFVANGDVDLATGLGSQTTAVSLFSSNLWPLWIGVMLLLFACRGVLAYAVYARGGWNLRYAWLNTLLVVAFSSVVAYLFLTGQLFNSDLVQYAFDREHLALGQRLLIAGAFGVTIIGGSLWLIVDGWRMSRR